MRGRACGPPIVKRVYTSIPITPRRMVFRDMVPEASKPMLRDLKPGDRVETYFSVVYKKPVVEYRYGHMFEFRVADKSGQATAKYWGDQDREGVLAVHASFDKDDVVKLRGDVTEFRGASEVSISQKDGGSITRMAEGEYDASQLIVSVEDIPGMAARLLEFADQVEEPHMKALVDSFFRDDEFMKEFSSCPASIQLHSAAFGGLLQHTLRVVETCTHICKMHPQLDRDLVLAGALLHDIGKVRSFRVTTHINHTPEGNLIGHISIGDEALTENIRKIEGFPEDLRLKLRHVMLSHHGRREWGSPVEPMLPEALAVHEADDVDAKLDYMIARRRDAVTEDDWVWDGRLGRLIYLK
jgi:3'-5' exoribonuclease